MTTTAEGYVDRPTTRDRIAIAFARRRVRDGVALALSFLAMTVWYHRLLLHLGDAVLFGPNDETYSIRLYWAADHFGKTPFTFHRDVLNGFPEGLPVSTAVSVANLFIPGTIWVLHYVMSITAAENVFLLGGFVLTGFSVYLLLDRLGFHPLATLYAAYAFTFNPWMIERAGAGHHGFMQAWVFPLEIAALLNAQRRRSVVSAVLAGLSVAVCFYESSYYGLLGTLVFVVFWGVDLARQPDWRERLWSFTLADIAFASAVVAFIPALIAWLADRQAVAGGVSNPVKDLQSLGASPESYILPSLRNPVLRRFTTNVDPLADFHWAENTLYLGWTLILLSVVGVVLVVRRHPLGVRSATLRFFLLCMVVLAPAAFLSSLKRETNVFGLVVPMPAYLVGEVTTFWRVFARFGLLVTFALAVLAALALHAAIRRWRLGWAVAVAAFALLVFEYYGGIQPIYSLATPPAWAVWLKAQPYGSVANYPLPTDHPEALTLLALTYYEQTYDEQPQFMLFGSGYGGTREDAIRILARYVDTPETPGILKAEQVEYVLLHDDVYRSQGNDPPAIPAGFHLVKRLPGHVRALELDASVQPADLAAVLEQNAASIALTQGLEAPKVSLDGVSLPGRIEQDVPLALDWSDLRLRRTSIFLEASASAPEASLQLVDGNGAVVAQGAVGNAPTALQFGPLGVSGTSARYVLRASPAGSVLLTSIEARPVADFSSSIRDVH